MKPTVAPPAPVEYPDDDGLPMADNTLQFEWIQVLTGNLAALYRDRADVFVGGNLLWYPVEGFPKIRRAPDALVVFDRPKVYRGSYKQWEEGNIPMTVVFEVRSPNDGDRLMKKKLKFYDRYEVEEYYMLDPEQHILEVYRRLAGQLGPQRLVGGNYTSPRLQIRFQVSEDAVAVFLPDGRPFMPFEEVEADRQRQRRRADSAEQRVVSAQQQVVVAQQQAVSAEQRVVAAEQQVTDLQRRAARLAELSRRARRGQASANELAELERLEEGLP